MKSLLVLAVLLGSKILYSQTITPGVYGPAQPVFGGSSFHFKENNMCEVCFFSCTHVGFGMATYTLEDTLLTLRYINHPGDTLKAESAIRYSGKAENDSIDISITVLRREEGIYSAVYPNWVKIKDGYIESRKRPDSTRKFYYKLAVTDLPCEIEVRAKATYKADILINQSQNADIRVYSPYSEYIDIDFIKPGTISKSTIKITPQGFDMVYQSNGERRLFPFIREEK
jgi:hypothetical protein